MAIMPRRGDALLFWDMHVDGRTVDRASLHASCPTLKGVKWTATKWCGHAARKCGSAGAPRQAEPPPRAC